MVFMVYVEKWSGGFSGRIAGGGVARGVSLRGPGSSLSNACARLLHL